MNRHAIVLEEQRIDSIFNVMRTRVELCNILMLTLTSGCSTQTVKHKKRGLCLPNSVGTTWKHSFLGRHTWW